MKILSIAALSLLLLSACGGGGSTTDGTATTPSTTNTASDATNNAASGSYTAVADLSQALNAPIKIKAPNGFKIVSNSGIIQEAIIEAPDYYVQVMSSDALTTDRKALKAEALLEAKAMKEFTAIVEEGDFGFVYETTWEGNSKAYNFRYFVVNGTKVLDFRSNSINNFSKAQVQGMYAAVKQE
jgi:hypothetical protein